MTDDARMFPRARIPYGTWGSSYFPAWQMSALAEVNIGQFGGEAANRICGLRKVPKREIEYVVVGSTIPWHWKFWNAPMVASCMGTRIPGCHVEQACATGLQATIVAGNEVQWGAVDVAAVIAFDRTSDSPVGVFPERRSYERTQAISDVWDNFGFDPATGKAMIGCAGLAARKYKIDRREVDDLTLNRYEQYFQARDSGWLDRVLVPLDVLNVQGRPLGRVDEDSGIRRLDRDALSAMRELDTCVTAGTQTHASDGMACLLVTTREKAKELSPRPEIDIQYVGKVD
ncbi:MAG: thiolase family protein, partial [Planctomycetota bacterium]